MQLLEPLQILEPQVYLFEEITNALSEKRNHPALMQMLQDMQSANSSHMCTLLRRLAFVVLLFSVLLRCMQGLIVST